MISGGIAGSPNQAIKHRARAGCHVLAITLSRGAGSARRFRFHGSGGRAVRRSGLSYMFSYDGAFGLILHCPRAFSRRFRFIQAGFIVGIGKTGYPGGQTIGTVSHMRVLLVLR